MRPLIIYNRLAFLFIQRSIDIYSMVIIMFFLYLILLLWVFDSIITSYFFEISFHYWALFLIIFCFCNQCVVIQLIYVTFVSYVIVNFMIKFTFSAISFLCKLVNDLCDSIAILIRNKCGTFFDLNDSPSENFRDFCILLLFVTLFAIVFCLYMIFCFSLMSCRYFNLLVASYIHVPIFTIILLIVIIIKVINLPWFNKIVKSLFNNEACKKEMKVLSCSLPPMAIVSSTDGTYGSSETKSSISSGHNVSDLQDANLDNSFNTVQACLSAYSERGVSRPY